MDRVKGKVAIITGAGSGIGEASAILLAKEGAKVVISDINETGGQSVTQKINDDGGEAIFIRHDISSESSWKEIISHTLAKFKKVDILLNNAGVNLEKAVSIEETSLEDWRWIMGVNLEGTFLGIKYAMEAMKKSGGGSIINISSAAGSVGTLWNGAYSASKGGVRILTKAAALECSKEGLDYNIRVNSIHPGCIETPLIMSLKKIEGMTEIFNSFHPMGHLGKPEDIAHGVLYLASDESKFCTGSELVIDGGWTSR